MEPRLLAKILLRLLAIYLVVRGIMFLPNLYIVRSAAQFHSDSLNPYLWSVITVLAPIVAGIILWALSPFIASWLVGANDRKLNVSMMSSDNIQEIVVGLAGLIIVILAIPEVVNWLIHLFTRSFFNGQHRVFDMDELAWLIASALQLLLGLWLFFGVRFWVRLFRKAREFGLSKPL
ncbi:MAG TPA: hypothetical protein VJR90_04140 [Gammaproteobacteria bacterium]|nr:hypothetical protein [Gammaproteobacteria bacterium]